MNVGEPEALRVSSGSQSAYITVNTIVYVVLLLGILLTAAVVDEAGDGPGFSADTAWFYAVLLSIGFMISRGLARINLRSDHRGCLSSVAAPGRHDPGHRRARTYSKSKPDAPHGIAHSG